ncbi:MAG: hypothetical protein C0514_08420 [Candidatus Puniceispirillum sp.]|nr:hypothetical protein [Candidatus Puniceispirillum sp.]
MELREKLKKYEDFSKNDNANHFLDVFEEIIVLKEPDSISWILDYFDDDTEYSWVFESMRKNLEIFDAETYVRSILIFLDKTKKNNKGWMRCFFYVILNSEQCVETLKKNARLCSKEKLLDILESIAENSFRHVPIIEDLKKYV